MNTILDDVDIDSNHLNVLYPKLNDDDACKYYDTSSFNKLKIDSSSDLLLLNLNIRSLSAHFDLFHGFSKLLDSIITNQLML